MKTTVFFACDPDDPTDSEAAFTKDGVNIQSFTGRVEPEEMTVDSDSDVPIASLSPTVGDEILCACWELGYLRAIADLLEIDLGKEWMPFGPDDFCSTSEVERHADLFCVMVGLCFGAVAEGEQREAFAGIEAE